MSRITVDQFENLMAAELPWAMDVGLRIESIENGRATMRLPFDGRMLRPGGTVSGPAMMGLADATMYAVVLSMIGKVTLAVTTSFNINFLRFPPPADIVAEGSAIKLGKRLAVIEVTLFTLGDHEPIAHATGTYSIPPKGE